MSLINRILAPAAHSNRDDADYHRLMAEISAIGSELETMSVEKVLDPISSAAARRVFAETQAHIFDRVALFTPLSAVAAGAGRPYFLTIVDPAAIADGHRHSYQDAAEDTQRLFRELWLKGGLSGRYGMDGDPFSDADAVWSAFLDYINAQGAPGTLVIITPTEAMAHAFGPAVAASFTDIADFAVMCGLLRDVSQLHTGLVQSLAALHQMTGIANSEDLRDVRAKVWGFLHGASIGEVRP